MDATFFFAIAAWWTQIVMQQFSSVDSTDQIQQGQVYTGMRLHVSGPGAAPVVWEDVQGAFVQRDAPDYHGGTVSAVFLDRTFPTGQVVQLGLNSRARTIRVEINGEWHSIATLRR